MEQQQGAAAEDGRGLPEGRGPGERATRVSWVVLGVVFVLVAGAMAWVGWRMAGTAGLAAALAIALAAVLLRTGPVLLAWWFRKREGSG